jgi:quercetin dioxygenase-like cupin family protein
VDGKVLLDEPVLLALLRFQPDGTINEHPGQTDTFVFCLEGEGWTSVGRERAQIHAGERVRWPKGIPHRLWTEGTTMTTLMFERPVPE